MNYRTFTRVEPCSGEIERRPESLAEIQDFQESVQEGRDPVASGIDGLRVVEATLAMIESATTGRTI